MKNTLVDNMERERLHRQMGSVMAEAVMVMPLLIVVFALLVFFGYGMVRFQRDSMMDRYETWREVTDGEGVNDEAGLNAAFLGGNADAIKIHREDYFPGGARSIFDASLADLEDPSQAAFIMDVVESFPSGRQLHFKTIHQEEVPIFHEMERPNRHGFLRIGNEWKFANGLRLDGSHGWVPTSPRLTHIDTIRETYYAEMDAFLDPMIDDGVEGADLMQQFYTFVPGYGGPHLD
ncbi:hypothetical protein [Poriferisphaera sp. WC338]|uniref:hypothetical protein n=1 Tax=Poriferisphaera sp. WC338 TaxID=3425129 RepID=UPI003D81B73A